MAWMLSNSGNDFISMVRSFQAAAINVAEKVSKISKFFIVSSGQYMDSARTGLKSVGEASKHLGQTDSGIRRLSFAGLSP